jgi:hypothetical protein
MFWSLVLPVQDQICDGSSLLVKERQGLHRKGSWFSQQKCPYRSSFDSQVSSCLSDLCDTAKKDEGNRKVSLLLRIGMLQHHRWCSRCNLKHKGSTCDQDLMLWLQTHICDWRCTSTTAVAYWWCHLWLESPMHDLGAFYNGKVTSPPEEHAHRIAYLADHFVSDSLSPLMYHCTFIQATLIHLHNNMRSVLVAHHYYCLNTSSNQPWWI